MHMRITSVHAAANARVSLWKTPDEVHTNTPSSIQQEGTSQGSLLSPLFRPSESLRPPTFPERNLINLKSAPFQLGYHTDLSFPHQILQNPRQEDIRISFQTLRKISPPL